MTIRLNIGCGANLYPLPWVNVDHVDLYDDTVEEPKRGYLWHLKRVTPEQVQTWPEEQRRHVEWLASGRLHFFQRDLRKGFPMYPDGSVEAIVGGQMYEHLQPLTEGPAFLRECFRMLDQGGALKLTTPDLDLLLGDYRNGSLQGYKSEQPSYFDGALPEDQLAYIMYGAGGTAERYDGHQHLYTRRSLEAQLKAAGFLVIQEREMSDYGVATMFTDVIDKGMSHSFAAIGVKP